MSEYLIMKRCIGMINRVIFLTVILLSMQSVAAGIQVSMADPEWHFLLQNNPLKETEAKLKPEERTFAKKIQPLLANKNYTAVLQQFTNRPIQENSAALRQLRGQVLLSLKKYNQAELALKSALKEMPDLAMAHRSLSMIYMIKKQYANAQKYLQRSIELGVADAQLYGQLAFVNLQTKHAASAVAGYQQALFLEPDNSQWKQGLLYALLNSRALNQAQSLVEEMLQKDSNNAELWLLRGQIAMQNNKPKKALSSLEISFHLGENNVANYVTAAQLHLQHGSTQRAVTLLSNNLNSLNAKNKKSIFKAIDEVTGWLIQKQDWAATKKMLKALNKVGKNTPVKYQARFNVYRAQIALEQGKIKQAKSWLIKAVKSDPTHGQALITLGDVYRKQNLIEKARIYYLRAEALTQFKEQALLSRAQLEIDRKAYPEALRILRLVAKINPTRGDVLSNIRSLENLVRNKG